MNKKKSLVLVLFMVVVLVLTTCMLVACNAAAEEAEEETSETVEIEATEGLVINNSDFKVVSSLKEYPTTATDWTGAKLYSSASYADDVIAGVINLTKESYDANKATWNDDEDALYNLLTANNKYSDADTIKNALMIYMPEASEADDDHDYGPTAYGFTSSSFTLEKSSYYKLSVNVLTKDIKGKEDRDSDGNLKDTEEPGARIYVSSNTYVEFEQINTNGAWEEYTVYIETGAEDTALTLNLSLGKYTSSYSYGLTTGYAIFDDLTLEKLEDDTKYLEAVDAEKDNAKLQTTTLKISNGRFDFGTTTLGTSSAPSNWTIVTGNSSDDDPAPTSKGYNAIIDLANFDTKYSDYSSTFYFKANESASTEGVVFANLLKNITVGQLGEANKNKAITNLDSKTIGTNVFMLSQQYLTAQGVKSSKSITIEKNKIYDISIDLYTYSIHGAGVSLILSGSNTKDIVIEGISENKSTDYLIGDIAIDPSNSSYIKTRDIAGASTEGWQTYHFYIQGNQFYDYTYNLTVWLGTDGTSSNHDEDYIKYSSGSSTSEDTIYDANGTFSNGWVFIDNAKLSIIDTLPGTPIYVKSDAATKVNATTDSTNKIIVDLSTDNLLTGSNILGNDVDTTNPLTGNPIATTIGNPMDWTCQADFDKKTAPVVNGLITAGLVNLQNKETTFPQSFVNEKTVSEYPGTPYNVSNNYAYVISASSDSYYEIQTAVMLLEKNATYRLSFWVKTMDVKSTSGVYAYLMQRNDGIDEEDESLSSITCVNTQTDDGNEWTEFTFYICGSNEEQIKAYLKFTLGTGTRWSSDTLTSGSVYIMNMNLSTIEYKAFSSASTGTYAKSVDLSSSYTYTFSNGSFDSFDKETEDLNANIALSENKIAGDPSDWTLSDKLTAAADKEKKDNLVAGVIQLNTIDADALTYGPSNQTKELFGQTNSDSYFTNIYGDPSTTAYYSSANLQTIAGPYMLALGAKDTSKSYTYSLGFTSNSFSMSAKTTYKLSVYAKTFGETIASIYLTGETSGSSVDSYFTIESNASGQDWTEYVYYITLGQSSISAKLNLWIGQNEDYISLPEAENYKYSSKGLVLFDNVVLTTIDEEDAVITDEKFQKKLSFSTDGFDTLSNSIESRKSLSSPSSWTNAVDTNQESANTTSGVIYLDSAYLNETDGYIDVLGKEYDPDDYTITDEEIQAAKSDAKYSGMKDVEILEALQKEKCAKDKEANLVTYADLTYGRNESTMGKQMLVINNTDKSAYIYTGASITFDANSYYKVSVMVRTLKLNDAAEAGAYIQLYLGDADESDNPYIFKAIKASEWTTYEFYVATLDDSVSTISLKLALGKYYEPEDDEDEIPSLTSGYAFFDNVTFTKIEQNDFDESLTGATKQADETTYLTSDGRYVMKRTVELVEEGTADDDEEDEGETETPTSSFNLEYLWWMIPTIILGLLTIIVIIVWVVKKIKAKQPKKAQVEDNINAVSTETIDEIRAKYDSNKE